MRGINLQALIFAIVALAMVILVQGSHIDEQLGQYNYEISNPTRKRYLVAANVRFNWKDAAAYCSQHNSEIATIESGDENEKLHKILKKLKVNEKRYWLGARDPLKNGIFQWYPKNEPLGYTYWLNDSPGREYVEDNEEHCLEMLSAAIYHRWSDNDCRYENAVVCHEFTQDPPSDGFEENVLLEPTQGPQIGEKEYIFTDNSVYYNRARNECERINANLVNIESVEEKEKLFQAMQKIVQEEDNTNKREKMRTKNFWIESSAVDHDYHLGRTKCIDLSYTFTGLLVNRHYKPCVTHNYVICEKIRG